MSTNDLVEDLMGAEDEEFLRLLRVTHEGVRPRLESPSFTWADAEARFPGCSAAWDRDGGHEWVAGRKNLTIVIIGSMDAPSLSVGCGGHPPFGWAIWNADREFWMFLS